MKTLTITEARKNLSSWIRRAKTGEEIGIIDGNTKRIVSECQAYLDRYEREGRPRFAVDIDRIVGLLEGEK